jgi:hypothetical protein
VATARVIKAIDIMEDRALSLTACIPTVAPDQLHLDRFEERFDHEIVAQLTFATH